MYRIKSKVSRRSSGGVKKKECENAGGEVV